MDAMRIPARFRLEHLVGASRTGCADTEHSDLDRVWVRPRRMLRDTQGVVIPADGSPRSNRAEPACVHLAWYAGTAPLPGTDLPLHSSAGPDLPSRAAHSSTVAGRLAPSAERPAHT